MTFKDSYIKIKDLFQDELNKIESKILISIDVHEPLNTSIKDFLRAPSKRIRPVLGLLYMKAKGFEINENQLELLSAVEIVHNASLIHDDIIDECDIRRGEKNVSAKFGNKLGVISGDYLLALAMSKIACLKNPIILKVFSKTLEKMCIGEINQNFDRFKIGTIEDYIEKSKNKTAYLFETTIVCCELLNSNPNFKNEEFYSDFAINFGIAFQIRDDLLNILKIDKSKPSSDIEEGIYNAPIIYSESVENYTKGIEKTKNLLNNYIERAKICINNFDKNIYTSALQELLESLKYD